MATTVDLYTTVINTSGKEMIFSYLGKHGKKLAAGASFTVFGDIQHSFPDGTTKQTRRRALERDLLAGRLAIVSTPRTIVLDTNPDAIVANPTVAATVAVTGGGASGGLMVAGHYKVAYTFVNSWGSTTIGTSTSADFTVATANIPRVTVPALPTNATSISLYVTDMHATLGDATTLHRYATGITGTTTDMATAVVAVDATHPVPPTTNTTQAHAARALGATDNVLGFVDPSWGSYTT
ncbi:MAG: hypothetical protein E6G97_17975 [Alphaproteobacteria bacterium]|nr:MAG: hypothetical protein E6G97_17975 [Alphaproteobacteria bacterium]